MDDLAGALFYETSICEIDGVDVKWDMMYQMFYLVVKLTPSKNR